MQHCSHRARHERAASNAFCNCLNGVLQLLLGAGNDALRQVREGLHLVNINTESVNAGVAGCFETPWPVKPAIWNRTSAPWPMNCWAIALPVAGSLKPFAGSGFVSW